MAQRNYLRDGRAPVPKDPRVSAIMSRIRASNTGPELLLRKALRDLGHTGYRLHYAKAPARPDIAFVGKRVAVLVHGCFWHGCPYCNPRRPRSHTSFWNTKLDANKARDARKARKLRKEGWRVITCWECRIKSNAHAQALRVAHTLGAKPRELTAGIRTAAGCASESVSRTPRRRRTVRIPPRISKG